METEEKEILTPEQEKKRAEFKEKVKEAILRQREEAEKAEKKRQVDVCQNRYNRWYTEAKLDGKSHNEAHEEAMGLLKELGLWIDDVQEVSK